MFIKEDLHSFASSTICHHNTSNSRVYVTSTENFNADYVTSTHIPSDSPNNMATRFVVKAFVTEPIPNKVFSVTGSMLSKSVTLNPFRMASCP